MNLEDRIKRRIATEVMAWTDTGADNDLVEVGWVDDFEGFASMAERLVTTADAARIATLEVEDSAKPIVQTEQVRPPLRLNIDIAAFQAVYDDLDHD